MLFRVLLVIVLSVSAFPVGAIEPRSSESIVIVHAGRAVIEPGLAPLDQVSIIVRGDRIDEIADGYVHADSMAKEDDATVAVLDLRQKTVLPGLIDAHVHLTMNYGGRTERYLKTDAELTIDGVENARLTLMSGVTTVRDVGDAAGNGAPSMALRDALQQGRIVGPRMLAAGPALSPTGGHADPPKSVKYLGERQGAGVCDGPADCGRAVRWNYRMGADLIKIHASGGGSEESGAKDFPASFSSAELQAIVSAARALHRKVAAHAHGTEGINAAILAGVDSIEHGSFLSDESIELFLEHKVTLVPTLSVLDELERLVAKGVDGVDGRNHQFLAEMPEAIGAAFRAGVRIAAGSDAGVTPHGAFVDELERLVSIGMSPAEALRSATVVSAELIELAGQAGTIAPGKWADLIAVDGDPTEQISVLNDVKFVMKGGRVYKSE